MALHSFKPFSRSLQVYLLMPKPSSASGSSTTSKYEFSASLTSLYHRQSMSLSQYETVRLNSNSSKPRSPYAVLNLRTSATKDEIKESFRKLAKKFHPDLNPSELSEVSHDKMAQLIQAYDHLMDDDFGAKVGDSRVALACEIYSLEELRIDRLHDVYSIRIIYHEDETDNLIGNASTCYETEEIFDSGVSTVPIIEIMAHPDDSISDLKRQIQILFLKEWGLEGRRLDRDKIATGWELVVESKKWFDEVDKESVQPLSILSYHLFLHSYGIRNRDIIHAVVRRYNEVES